MRMIILILLALIARVAGVNAQSDVTKLSVTYEVQYQKVEEVAKREKDLMRLDLGKHSSQYVSIIGEFLTKHRSDIIAKRIKNPYAAYAPLHDEVFKNTLHEGYLRFVHMPGWVSCREKMEGMFSWQLQDGDSIVCSYPCHKATATFRGRTWTVWYTLDLPYSDGPWKLSGLPGLILHARDNEGKLIFNCIGIEKGDGHSFSYPSSKKIRLVSPERMEELLIFEAYDIEGFKKYFDPTLVGLKVYDRNGRLISNIHWTAVPYEVFPQNHKKKPAKKKQTLGKAKIPVAGSGKVKVGQRINILLDGYPYLEYAVL